MSESIIDFSHILEFEGNRQNLESTYRPTEEEKQIAIQKLYNKASFLSSLKWKTRTEANRLIWQKELLADVNVVLMFLKSKNPPINEDYLQKFIGNYQANADSIPVHLNIFLDDEQLYVNLPTGKLKLIPFSIDTFFSQTPTIQFNFDFEKDSVAGQEIITTDSQIQFAKIDNE